MDALLQGCAKGLYNNIDNGLIMALFGLFGKKRREEMAAPPMQPPEMGLGGEYELGLPRTEEYAEIPREAPPVGAPPGMGAQPGASPYMPPMRAEVSAKDIELLSAKLDALKAILDSINQRLIALEQMASEGRGHERYY
jgi:hypothetical protein